MRLVRNICKECNEYNFLEREFNYELGLCNKCLKKSLMPKYEYRGYFSCKNIPNLQGRLIDFTDDCKYIVTSTGLYEISGLNKLYDFKKEISTGAFSDDGNYFVGFSGSTGFCLKNDKESWIKIEDITIYETVEETIFSDREFFLIIIKELYCILGNSKDFLLAKLNIDDFSIKFLSNADSNLLKSFFKKPHKYNDFIKRFYAIPSDFIDSDYLKVKDLYPLDESHFVISSNGKFFVDLNHGKSIKIDYYSGADKYLYANKLNLLIYSDYVIDRSGFDRCLVVFSTENYKIVLQLYFDYPIRGHYISKDNSLLVVVTKDISYVISTHNWNIVARLEHNDQVKGCVILDNKTIITETDKGYLYLWSNIL